MSIPIKDITNAPLTPRKRKNSVSYGEKKSKKVDFGLLTPTKERSTSSTIYSQAKELFKRGNTNISSDHILVGRDEEAKEINDIIMDDINNNTNDSLYISGPPGTGKTAQIVRLTNHIKLQNKKVKVIHINCMIINNPESIFHEIVCMIQDKILLLKSGIKRSTITDLIELLSTDTTFNNIIIILDELDHLITKDQQLLFELFNLITNTSLKTKLIIIGISNALDLTDKFLPRLRRNGISPKKLCFLPYDSNQIKLIIESKLKKLPIQLFHPMAIMLCSRKAASITGDLRKAFDICYKAIELVEKEQRIEREQKNEKSTNENPFFIKSDKSSDTTISINSQTTAKVLISHVSKVCANSFGSDISSRLSHLNLLQKVLMCCLWKSGASSVDEFYIKYQEIVKDRTENLISVLKRGEFLEVVSALESMAVVALNNSKGKTKSKDFGCKIISLSIPKDELLKSIGNIGVLNKIIK